MRCARCEPDYCACADFYAGRMAYWKGEIMPEADECPCDKCQADKHGWLPIKTAPRDGTPLLLFARCVTATAPVIVIGWYIEGRGWIEMAFHPNNQIGIVPTHWQRLPAFPERGQ
jgi:hypothetical protein